MSFYQGSVAEAVASSRAGFKPLIVLLTGIKAIVLAFTFPCGCSPCQQVVLPAGPISSSPACSGPTPQLSCTLAASPAAPFPARCTAPVAGQDEAGAAAERNLLSQSGAEHMAGSILLRLEDDLSSSNPSQFTDAKNFRAFCPTNELPTVSTTLRSWLPTQGCTALGCLRLACWSATEGASDWPVSFFCRWGHVPFAKKLREAVVGSKDCKKSGQNLRWS